MKKVTFKIRRKIILAFVFCFLSVVIFAIFSFEGHREIGIRLRLVEVADDLVNSILEVRRFEKNFFLYKQRSSLQEALSYADRVERLYLRHEADILSLAKGPERAPFLKILARYKETLSRIQSGLPKLSGEAQTSAVTGAEESLRNIGQKLLDIATAWAKEQRTEIDRLFRRVLYLFIISMVFFVILGVGVAFYISRLVTRPLVQMQQAMEKIADGDFTPVSMEECGSEEFLPLFQAINRMIHELEERQEQLVQARKISAIGTFTSGVAHELNNPVNNIVLTAESLKDDWGEVDREEALSMIDDILIQSERASEIIKNLLDFSRSERPEMVPLSVSSVIEDTLRLVRNQLLLSSVEEETDVPEDLPLVRGDYKSLQQVFLNLFINAIQSMPGGGRLSTKARPSYDGHSVKIEVRDTGAGIDAAFLPRIFDPFFTTKEVGRGTGLGLSVTYGILQKHGGSIAVQSEKGRGTTFTVILPCDSAGEHAGTGRGA
ncbi:MAG: ATP-binding protein [Deltaproteobacteria bacterium]